MTSYKVISLQQLKFEVAHAKLNGREIVTTNGCFDLLHIGHVKYLETAKQLGDILIVGINSDDSVKALKGSMCPLMSEIDRAEIVAALECVDYVLIFPELDPRHWLSEIKPDIHVKGGDYKVGDLIEREVVESNGGKIAIVPTIPDKSTTKIIERIREYGKSSGFR